MATERVKVGTFDMTGYEMTIGAGDNGMWTVSLGEEALGYADTLDKAKQQARTALAKRKVKVEVPFLTMNGEHGIATGIHAASRKVLARINGRSAQLDGWRDTLRPDTPREKIERLIEVRDEQRSLAREEREITDEFKLDLRREVEQAVNVAAGKVVFGDEEDDEV